MAVGMITDTRAGRNSLATSRPEVTLPRIQSMMVVTSPMGEKGSAAVGRDDDNAGEDPSFFLSADHTPQQHDHNDRRGHVVQHGGHKEGDDR